MAEEAESPSGCLYPVLRIDGQSGSFSLPAMPHEDGGGRHLEAAYQRKPCDLHPYLRNDLYPADTNRLKAHSPPLDFGQAMRTASSGFVRGSSDRLCSLTPIHTKNSSGTVFTTSPTSSDSDSPCLPGVRSSSNTSLNQFQGPVHYSPRPPTPAVKMGRGCRTSSAPGRSPHSRKSSSSRPRTPHPRGKRSVKHLTCFWWKEKGDCRFKEQDCLYAHHDTGLYADPPRQVVPGGRFPGHATCSSSVTEPTHCHRENITDHTHDAEPAMAGRSLDRALKKLYPNHNKSSSSLGSMPPEMIHTDNASRPGIPGTPGTEQPMSSVILEQLKAMESAHAAAKSDNAFLRTLVEQNAKEKAVLVAAVENLQIESKSKSLYVQWIFVIELLDRRKHI
jgi:hypothetical protein